MAVQGADIADACVAVLVPLGAGFLAFAWGVRIRLGRTKRYFLTPGPAPLFGPANYHFIILFGVVSITLGVAILAAVAGMGNKLLGYLFIPSFILAFIVGFWQPWWLKPRWIRQLKENHPDIYPFLREAAQEEVGKDRRKADEWSAKMDTVEGQNEWVAEVRKRLGMPDPRAT